MIFIDLETRHYDLVFDSYSITEDNIESKKEIIRNNIQNMDKHKLLNIKRMNKMYTYNGTAFTFFAPMVILKQDGGKELLVRGFYMNTACTFTVDEEKLNYVSDGTLAFSITKSYTTYVEIHKQILKQLEGGLESAKNPYLNAKDESPKTIEPAEFVELTEPTGL